MNYRRITRELIRRVRALEESVASLNRITEAEWEAAQRAQRRAREAERAAYEREREAQWREMARQEALADLNQARRWGDEWGIRRALKRLEEL